MTLAVRLPVLLAAVTTTVVTLGAPGVQASDDAAVLVGASQGPVRILIEGDSITSGTSGDFTWRYRLWQEFRRQGRAVDFVGPYSFPATRPGYTHAAYLDPDFDSDHFSASGTTVVNEAENIDDVLTLQQPDVVVFACGLNDIRNHNATADQVIKAFRDYVTAARRAKPDIQILVAPVLPVNRPDLPYINPVASDYDAQLRQLVPTLSTRTSPIELVDVAKGYQPTPRFTYDGIHLTATGETRVAQNVAEALHRIGVLPRQPRIFHGDQAWPRGLRPLTELRADHRLAITWDHQALTGARVDLRRRPGPFKELPHTVAWSYLTRPLPPGTYDVRLRGVREEYQSTLGPRATLKVPG